MTNFEYYGKNQNRCEIGFYTDTGRSGNVRICLANSFDYINWLFQEHKEDDKEKEIAIHNNRFTIKVYDTKDSMLHDIDLCDIDPYDLIREAKWKLYDSLTYDHVSFFYGPIIIASLYKNGNRWDFRSDSVPGVLKLKESIDRLNTVNKEFEHRFIHPDKEDWSGGIKKVYTVQYSWYNDCELVNDSEDYSDMETAKKAYMDLKKNRAEIDEASIIERWV